LRQFDGPYARASISTSGTCGLLRDDTLACPEGSRPLPTGRFRSFSLVSDAIVAIRWDRTLYQFTSQPLPDEQYLHVHTNGANSCGVLTDGSLVCVSSNGELSEIRNDAFVEVAREFLDRVCARRVDGSVACWNDATLQDAVDSPVGEFTALATYYDGFCGIRTDGTTHCWSQTPANALVPPPGW
jgi:hypothetical protein